MNLNPGLTNRLTGFLQAIETQLEYGANVCGPLSEFTDMVNREAAKRNPKLTPEQAQTILDAVTAVEGQLGCGDLRR